MSGPNFSGAQQAATEATLSSKEKSITLTAYAKINLTLEVLGRRSDGYHEVASIMQTIGLSDTLTFESSDSIELECDKPDLLSDDNLTLVAARMLKDEAAHQGGARIGLRKGIPVSAGLGGGSSDAASTLLGLNRMWGLGLSVADLAPLAARIGSDVPFFLHGGTAMVHRRGDLVRPLPPADLGWVMVLAPHIDLPDKTAAMYAALPETAFTRGALTRKLEARVRGGGDVPPQFLFNVFDNVGQEAYPALREYWDVLYSLGARELHLAGSGSAIYAPVSRKEVGTAIQLILQRRYGWEAHLVTTLAAPGESAG